ncbi:putative U-box domain-containing protein 42 [Aristolochia californica]|uniref:putative U-box domain-containing protein 42 n=1 Tax=Aristolochia californica TaxID=171875 RepID=UPI0035DED7E0
MSLREDTNSILILAQTIVTSIAETIQLIVDIEIETETFMEVGCYLHRAFPAVMELRTTENTPNASEILNSLLKNVNLAKDLISKCSSSSPSVSKTELDGVISGLESVVRSIGENLSCIPSSTFENNGYAECAVRSMSREMQSCIFQTGGIQMLEVESCKEDHSCMKRSVSKEQPVITENELVSLQTDAQSSGTTSEIHNGDMPRLVDFLRVTYSRQGSNGSGKQPLKTLPQVAEYMEPLYETFFCPLTKKLMDDPVTITSGVTYERRAITEWFNKCEDGSESLLCPITGQKLENRFLNTNLALKTTIEEWKERNEATRIKVARTALSLASSESMIGEALQDLQVLGKRRKNRVQIRDIGLIPLLAGFLEHEDTKVRCETLKTLQLLAEDDDGGKESISHTKAIPTTFQMLSSDRPPERHLALSFLLKISRSEPLCENMGSVGGGILKLITMKYSTQEDASAAEKADGVLKNLEKSPKNIKLMAENGLLDPLLNHLTEGSEDTQMEMVSCLGEIGLTADAKAFVAGRASNALFKMIHSGNSLTRKAAFKALVHISDHHPSSKLLVEVGIISIMIEELFTRRIYDEPMDSKEESAAILANILGSGVDLETLKVNPHGHTMTSEYTVYNIIYMLKSSGTDEFNKNLIKILLFLTKSPRAMASIVSAIKEADATYKLIELIDSLQEELTVVSTKLLICLSVHMGHTIADRLCKTKGQPENLIIKLDTVRITEKHAVWASLLSKLPHQNLTLNLALLHKGVVPTVLQRIHEIQRGETRGSRCTSAYLEGLVGTLVRLTTTLYDAQILFFARSHNLASVFTELLMGTGSDEVLRLAAIGLENLSSESIHLSRPPQKKNHKFKLLRKCFSMVPTQNKKLPLCPVHRGECSSETTFCLVESHALERLLACLKHENVQVVEAALSALCTLLDDKVDVDKSVSVLSEVNTIQYVLNVLREHKQETVWQKSFWVIERFLMKGDTSVNDISNDRFLPSTLVSAFHGGDSSTRQMAEKILKHLNKMPASSSRSNL